MKNLRLIPVTLIAMAVLAGCNSTKPTSALMAAHDSYNSASANPGITTLAPLELKEAGDTLARADLAASKGEDVSTIDHLAYLTEQKVAIARETASRKNAEAAVSSAQANRNEVRLEARTAEANAANQQVAVMKDIANRQAEELAAADANAASDQALIMQQQDQLKTLNAKQTERGLVITLGDVLFATNKAELKLGGMNSVQKLADFLKYDLHQRVLIEGYTDSMGSESYNQQLSERRAEKVRDALVNQMGISSDRVSTRGYGEQYPIASNANATGRQLNRRVEIVLSDAHGNITSR
ncbi:MAG: OmpA family protein [Sideroxydans sp.]|jgi:outer membrane protein OmpA-like peptidoglycan-associated protein